MRGRRFPQIDFDGVRSVFYEPEAGYLLARRACQAVAEAVGAEGGEVRIAAAFPDAVRRRVCAGARGRLGASSGPLPLRLRPLAGRALSGGDRGAAPPRHPAGGLLLRHCRRGTPGSTRTAARPGSTSARSGSIYGMPGNEHRGFKVADDTRGAPFDPTFGERLVTPAS